MENENSSFTFWANMKEIIEVYKDEVFKYKLYDAITEYGLYGVWPEDDGTVETQSIISCVQAVAPSLDKSRGYYDKMAKVGSRGGRKPKITDEQLHQALVEVTRKLKRVPTRAEIVAEVAELFKVDIDIRTISRRVTESDKGKVLTEVLKEKMESEEGNTKKPHFDF